MIPSPIDYPDHNIDPREKGKDFIMQMAKACEYNWNTTIKPGIFRAKADKYAEIRDYAFNRQSIAKHQKELLPEDDNDETFTKISWDTKADGMVLRNIAVSKVQQVLFNWIVTPINENAKDAQDDYYAKMAVKLMLQKAIQQNNIQTDHPVAQKSVGDPKDLDELETEMKFSPKFNRAKDAEEALEIIKNDNDFPSLIYTLAEDIVDFGVMVAKDDLNSRNKVILEHIYPGDFACSKCNKPDFSDMTWAFVVKSTKLSELAKHFDADTVENIRNKFSDAIPQLSTSETNGYDAFKADVMDLEFVSWDKQVTETNYDANGNPRTSFADPKGATKKATDKEFIPRTVENIYRCKWVIGTDYMYDYDKATNIKRDMSIETMSKCQMSFHVVAVNFHDMEATGLTETMMPIIDDLNNTTFKIRMFKNMMVPNGFDIDIAALESIPWGAGGKKLTIKQAVNMFFETGVLLNRRSGAKFAGNNFSNYKAINAITNSMGEQLIMLLKEHADNKQALRDAIGLNELTDGSSPNPKMLTTVANLANQATNNALWPYIAGKQKIETKIAKGAIKRCQAALLNGPYDGYDPKSGRYITVSSSLLDFDYDLKLEATATDEQKQWLYDLVKGDIQSGVLNSVDVIHIINTYNLKEAQELLTKIIDKNKEKAQAFELQKSQIAAAESGKTAIALENAKMQNDLKRNELELEKINLEQAWAFLIQKEKNKQLDAIADKKADTEIMKVSIGSDSAPNTQSQLPGSAPMQGQQPTPRQNQQPAPAA